MERKRIGPLVVLLILVAVMGVAFVGYDVISKRYAPAAQEPAQTEATEGESSGKTADSALLLADYDATVYTDTGEAVTLSSLAGGKPLVINFWATWCPYCVDELPDFQEIVADYGDRVSFAFVDVVDGQREFAEDSQAWLAENGFTDLPDYYDADLAATAAFGVHSFPTTVVVSADGEILSASAGRIDPILLRGSLDQLV